jgi:hypothetical protein
MTGEKDEKKEEKSYIIQHGIKLPQRSSMRDMQRSQGRGQG